MLYNIGSEFISIQVFEPVLHFLKQASLPVAWNIRV
jgi:hypothetical protein